MSFVCFYDMSDDFPEKDRIIRETLYTYVYRRGVLLKRVQLSDTV